MINPKSYVLNVIGMKYRKDIDDILFTKGKEVILKPDKNNEHDKNAIACYMRNKQKQQKHIRFIKKEDIPRVDLKSKYILYWNGNTCIWILPSSIYAKIDNDNDSYDDGITDYEIDIDTEWM